jgi:hypothetical protein
VVLHEIGSRSPRRGRGSDGLVDLDGFDFGFDDDVRHSPRARSANRVDDLIILEPAPDYDLDLAHDLDRYPSRSSDYYDDDDLIIPQSRRNARPQNLPKVTKVSSEQGKLSTFSIDLQTC